jgi:hypothetical protein
VGRLLVLRQPVAVACAQYLIIPIQVAAHGCLAIVGGYKAEDTDTACARKWRACSFVLCLYASQLPCNGHLEGLLNSPNLGTLSAHISAPPCLFPIIFGGYKHRQGVRSDRWKT